MIRLAKHLKGVITIHELENLPNRYVQIIRKDYFDETERRKRELKEEEKKERQNGNNKDRPITPPRITQAEAEELEDELEDMIGG